MNAAIKTDRIVETSPRLKARMAGVFYLVSVLTAVVAEFLIPGRLGLMVAVFVPVACYAAVTLLMYGIFKPVSQSLSSLMVCFSLVGLGFEALRWNPRGVDVAVVLHGFYCLLAGYLIVKSAFLPRILGVLMMIAGLVWLIYLSPPLADFVAPYNTIVGLAGESLPMLWLLVMGVNSQRWKQQAGAGVMAIAA